MHTNDHFYLPQVIQEFLNDYLVSQTFVIGV